MVHVPFSAHWAIYNNFQSLKGDIHYGFIHRLPAVQWVIDQVTQGTYHYGSCWGGAPGICMQLGHSGSRIYSGEESNQDSEGPVRSPDLVEKTSSQFGVEVYSSWATSHFLAFLWFWQIPYRIEVREASPMGPFGSAFAHGFKFVIVFNDGERDIWCCNLGE